MGSGPVVSGPRGAGHFLRSAGIAAGPVVPGRRFRRVLLPRQRPGQCAAQPAATALLLQAHDKVSDAEAKARADFDIRWKVALGIEVEDRPFAKSTLQVFRAQLILHDKVREVFESSLRLAPESGYLKKRSMKVALDTTNILGRGAVKDTYNLLADGIVNLLRALAAVEKTTVGKWAKVRDTGGTLPPASRARLPSTGRTSGHGQHCWPGLWPTPTGCWNCRGRRKGNWRRIAPSGSR